MAVQPETDFDFSLDDGGIPPMQGSDGAAAFDLLVPEDVGRVSVVPGHITTLNMRIRVAIPKGMAGLMIVRSGLGSKTGLGLANTAGLIDSDYRGPLIAKLSLLGPGTMRQRDDALILRSGEPVLQLALIVLPSVTLRQVTSLDKTERGNGGFGSTTERTIRAASETKAAGDSITLGGLARGKTSGKS